MAAIFDFNEGYVFFAEHMTFGKLVTERDGPIDQRAVSEVTSASSGLDRLIRPALSPQFLTGPRSWDPDDLCETSRRRGALLARPVRLRAGWPPHMAAARIRFRPEAGEGKAGRVTAQSSARFFHPVDWRRNAPFILEQILPALEAVPDLANRDERERLAEPAFSFRPRPLPDIPLAQVPAGVWSIIGCLAEGGPCQLGRETFSSETAFLRGLAFVFDLLDESAGPALSMPWASGYSRSDPRYAIQYFPDRVLAPCRRESSVIDAVVGGRDGYWRRFAAGIRDFFRHEFGGQSPADLRDAFRAIQDALKHAWYFRGSIQCNPARMARVDYLLANPATRQEGEAELTDFVETFRLLFPSEIDAFADLEHVGQAVSQRIASGDRTFVSFFNATREIADVLMRAGEGTDVPTHCEAVVAGAIARLDRGEPVPKLIIAAACRQMARHGHNPVVRRMLDSLLKLAMPQPIARDEISERDANRFVGALVERTRLDPEPTPTMRHAGQPLPGSAAPRP